MCIKKIFAAIIVSAGCFSCIPAHGADYAEGVIVINENQYGKSAGTINRLLPQSATWNYKIFATENPGRSLGSTPCFGAYSNGKLYVVSKFAQDPGAATAGGILTVIDGTTMKWIGQIDNLDPSGARAAGRAFLAVDDEKGYVSSSNGVWVVNLSTLTVKGQIDGTENPFGTDSKPVGDPTGALYFGQCGAMVEADGKVFVAHQSKGVLVIDAATDKVVSTLSLDCVREGAGVGSVVRALDGSVWASVSVNTEGSGSALGYLMKIDPATLGCEVVELPSDVYGPSSLWSSWSADTFCASAKTNTLFWSGSARSRFADRHIYSFDIATSHTQCIADLEADEDEGAESWKVHCPSLRVDPATGNLFTTLFRDVVSTTYIMRQYTPEGAVVADYPMDKGYWFAGPILFPESQLAGVENVAAPSAPSSSSLSVRWNAGVLDVACNSSEAATGCVCDTAGRIVAVFNLENGVASVPFSAVPGCYIVKASSASAKFIIN